ncbi:DUF5825 family protein [Streptomyces sp. NPDC091268]|uniref:DUF5825 family protein n=1 Tax=Streptomyces sp. NPDC091268 TaxID=3365979 RepID=UPI0037F79A56
MSVLTDIRDTGGTAPIGHIEHTGRTGPLDGPPDRPAAATLTLGADGAPLPSAAELAAQVPAQRVAAVRLAPTADFTALPARELVRLLALVRECSSIGVPVSWSLALDEAQRGLVPRLDHLPAPDRTAVSGEEATALDAWRSREDFGLLYFRKGPGFLSVTDNRPESCRRIILEDPAVTGVFLRALEGCAWEELGRDPQDAAAAADLVDQGLLLRLGDQCVTLPVHMRTWPLGAALLGGTLASAGKKPEEVGH